MMTDTLEDRIAELEAENARLREGAAKMEALLRTVIEGDPGNEAARIVQDINGEKVDLANIPRLRLEDEWQTMLQSLNSSHEEIAELRSTIKALKGGEQ